MFNVGPAELLVVALVLLIAVGPEQLPGVIRKVGQLVSQFRGLTEGIRSEFMAGLDEIERAADPREWAKDDPSSPTGANNNDDDLGDEADEADVTADLGDEADEIEVTADLGDEADEADEIDVTADLGDEADEADVTADLGDEADITADPRDRADGTADLDDEAALADPVDGEGRGDQAYGDVDGRHRQVSGNGLGPRPTDTVDHESASSPLEGRVADGSVRPGDQAGSAGGGDAGS